MIGQLICQECQTIYAPDAPRWRCDCGALLDIGFRPIFDLGMIARRKPTMWRYREAIPIQNEANIVSFDEGFTPLIEVRFDGRPVWIKQDHLFPTGSYKDRGASVLVSMVKALGVTEVVEDSSGNAGSAIAAYCAKAGINCRIFVPQDTTASKLAQIQCYGARLNTVPGTRENTANAALEAAEMVYYASHSWNPFFLQGTKTFAFEVCEQLGWRAPDVIILPVGNGTLLLGTHLGFTELLDAGIISKQPRIVAVQAENCAPLHQAFVRHLEIPPQAKKRPTLAEGIAIANPVRGKQILRVVRESDGAFIVVGEAEIEAALTSMCGQGFYIEPTSAATIAGISKYLCQSSEQETIVSVFTGHGLKATKKILRLG